MTTKQSDPSPDEIRQACREIQSTWSPAERHRRLRPDWRNHSPEIQTASTRETEAMRHTDD